MATFITHGIFASLFSYLWTDKKTKFTVFILLIIASILPDIDFVLQDNSSKMFSHRGITHSLFFSGMVAVIFTTLLSSQVKSFWHTLVLLTLFFLASASHIFLDSMTEASFGVCVFCPFNEERYFFPFTPFSTYTTGISKKGFRPGLGNSVWVTLLPEILLIWLPTFVVYFFSFYSGKNNTTKVNKNTTYKPIQIKPKEPPKIIKKTPKKK